MYQKIPPLECPNCKSKAVSKNCKGSIECEDCQVKTTVKGKKEKVVRTKVPHTRGRNYPEGYWD